MGLGGAVARLAGGWKCSSAVSWRLEVQSSACLDFGGAVWRLLDSGRAVRMLVGLWLCIPAVGKALEAQTAPSGVYLSVGAEPQPRTEPP